MCSIENQEETSHPLVETPTNHITGENVKLVSLEQDNDPDGYLSTIERATMALKDFPCLKLMIT